MEAAALSLEMTVRNRREPAPHPGPALKRDYLDPLGLGIPELAAHVRMDPARLRDMLEGERPIDVETAIRIGRALQLNPQIIMERQIRHEFAERREDEELESVGVLPPSGTFRFPDGDYRRGRLAGLRETWGYGEVRPETLGFLADAEFDGEDVRARLHELRTGHRLRVYDPGGGVLWSGVVLENLVGQPLLPYVRPSTWIGWFVHRYRADLAIPRP